VVQLKMHIKLNRHTALCQIACLAIHKMAYVILHQVIMIWKLNKKYLYYLWT